VGPQSRDYGTPEYLTYYRNELRELLTNYGRFLRCGSTARMAATVITAARGRNGRLIARIITTATTRSIVREVQPDALMFSDAGPDVHWVGNEKGIAGETCWPRSILLDASLVPTRRDLTRANAPARLDARGVRCLHPPGWFYHASQDAKVKTPEQLVISIQVRWSRRVVAVEFAAGSARTHCDPMSNR